MKIVHVMNWYVPKMGYQENFLPSEQKKLGHDVEIITSDRVPPYKGFNENVGDIIGERIIGSGVFEENCVTIHRLPILFEIKDGGQTILKGLKKKLEELEPDIVQAHGVFSPSTLQVIIDSKQLGYNVFVDEHSGKSNFNPTSFIKKKYVRMCILFYKIYGNRVCHWMPVIYPAKQMIQSILEIPDEKIDMHYLGADTSRFKRSEKLRQIGREKINVKDNCILIITTGKFSEGKNIPFLINAFADVVKKSSETKLLLVGNGTVEDMDLFNNLIEKNELTSNIIFKDFVPNSELPIYLNAADIGVWPGDPSITVIEAIATGLPVILPCDDLSYKHLFDNDLAIGFDKGNIESLSERILTLLKSNEFRSEIAENSKNFVAEMLSWDKIAEKSIQIYKNDKI